mmetsp:Transcript_26097/g.83589  ORF Transcript_26097/g.83589 Transcript_26097/m.83589 type:complete len:224 (+) Transcript_26097:409-1080(+)
MYRKAPGVLPTFWEIADPDDIRHAACIDGPPSLALGLRRMQGRSRPGRARASEPLGAASATGSCHPRGQCAVGPIAPCVRRVASDDASPVRYRLIQSFLEGSLALCLPKLAAVRRRKVGRARPDPRPGRGVQPGARVRGHHVKRDRARLCPDGAHRLGLCRRAEGAAAGRAHDRRAQLDAGRPCGRRGVSVQPGERVRERADPVRGRRLHSTRAPLRRRSAIL